MKNRKPEGFKVLLVFALFFLCNGILLYLPLEFKELRIFNGKWNWSGKIFAIVGAIIFLLIYRKFSLKDYYLTFKQDKKFLKKGIIIISAILFIQSILDWMYGPPKAWNTETILYQLTMPGFNEEIAFRGIMLGLLAKILKSNAIIHPAIVITALLFGMAHGLFLNNSYELIFNSSPFFNTMILGLIWAWITMKTGSIVLALISHNLGNVMSKLIGMSK